MGAFYAANLFLWSFQADDRRDRSQTTSRTMGSLVIVRENEENHPAAVGFLIILSSFSPRIRGRFKEHTRRSEDFSYASVGS